MFQAFIPNLFYSIHNFQVLLENDFSQYWIWMEMGLLILKNSFMDFLKYITLTLRPKSSLPSMCKYPLASFIITMHSYDFDKDGFVKKEDARLILSHIPIEKTILGGNIQGEGKFTSEGGGK